MTDTGGERILSAVAVADVDDEAAAAAAGGGGGDSAAGGLDAAGGDDVRKIEGRESL